MKRLALLLLCSCGAPESPCGPSHATVARVIDGDTIELTDGTRIRYLNVDAPETTLGHHDCFGAEAAAANAQWVSGREVELHYDSVCTDRYGRTLAYVSVDGFEVNRALVDQGLACALFIPPDGATRANEFSDAESVAKTARRGLWGVCADVPCDH